MSRKGFCSGFTVVELMVAVAIGLILAAIAFAHIAGSASSVQMQTSLAQMNEDAQQALSILSRDIRMAGYSQPTEKDENTLKFSNLSRWVEGCSTGLGSGSKNPVLANPMVCSNDDSDAIELAFEADADNTVATGAPDDRPSNCLGNAIFNQGSDQKPVFIARNRYFVSKGPYGRPELYCGSPKAEGDTSSAIQVSQPLVENIEKLRILYGMQAAGSPGQIVRYVNAAQIRVKGMDEWRNVVSVQLCLTVRSADPIASTIPLDRLGFADCEGKIQLVSDRHLRRAFQSTYSLRSVLP